MSGLLIHLLALVLTGAAAGLLAGLLGIGGGLVFVPALLAVLLARGVPDAVAMHLAVGSSLAAIVFASITSIRAHARRGNVNRDVYAKLLPGLLLGGITGAALASVLAGDLLRQVFGVFLLGVAVQTGFGLQPDAARRFPGRGAAAVAGGVIGSVSALLGIGGGTLSVPYLTWCNLPMLRAVGTAAASGLPIAAAGTAGFIVTGWNTQSLPPGSSGFVYWPAVLVLGPVSMLFAPLGARLAQVTSASWLRRLLAVVLVVVALRLMGFTVT